MRTLAQLVRERDMEGLRARRDTLDEYVRGGRAEALLPYATVMRDPEMHVRRGRYDRAIDEMQEFNCVLRPILKVARIRRFAQLLDRRACQ